MTRPAAITISLSKSILYPNWSDEGITTNANLRKSPILMRTTLTLNGKVYQATVTTLVTSKPGKGGTFAFKL
jgi:hypothetical protein